MRECKRHPSESQPCGGVCARCLEERLIWLWRGESFRLDDPDQISETSVSVSDDPVPARSNARPLVPREDVGSVAALNTRKQLQLNEVSRPPVSIGVNVNQRNGSDTVDGSKQQLDGNIGPTNSRNLKVAMVGSTDLHAQRRRNLENGLEFELAFSKDSPRAFPKLKSKNFESIDSTEPSYPSSNFNIGIEDIVARLSVEANPRFNTLVDEPRMFRSRSLPLDSRSRTEDTGLRVINEQADDIYFEDRSRSLPLDTRSRAEDTALRVINEQAGDACFEEKMQRFGYYGIDRDGNGGGESLNDNLAEQGCFSPKWQSKKSPKWVKVLVSPMTSRNRVFPSRSKDDVRRGRGSRKRGTRFASSDWSHKEANGGMSPQQRSPVFSWLQGPGTKNPRRHDQRGQLASSSSSSLSNSVSTDSWLRDLTTVGHLHEIAEELEIEEESSEEEEEEEEAQDQLDEMASFGKFLVSAARRQPNAGLTRLVSATTPSVPCHQS
ncbi:uncharacterized protein [Physcomitrium patens]|uniref:Uncharacterized protein n=1 Tax=Physcomitrium patens TaxID=3218 RepID=A9SPH6_PHYPA|nr:uncharacterized protein LOC112276715 isoform X2 [Physcomitrium patens]|eukprot:XP_024364098.1 uncharacterized protein LOC112276715 isoform X2 [Physcomitrella patens]